MIITVIKVVTNLNKGEKKNSTKRHNMADTVMISMMWLKDGFTEGEDDKIQAA